MEEAKAKSQFFKVMLEDFNKKLEIPKAFLKNMSKLSSEMAILEGPDGSSWRVRLNRTSDGLYLEDGWEIFSRDHCVSFGEFLVFKYNGSANFTVRIFGTTTVERSDGFAVMNSQPCEGSKRRGRPRKTGSKVQEISTSTLKRCELNQNAEHQQENCKPERRTHHLSKGHKDKHGMSSDDGAHKIFKGLDPKPPSFTMSMKPSHKVYMTIPSWFSEKNITDKVESVTLEVSDGRTWSVGCSNTRGYYRLQRGWINFRTDMNLEEGDVCRFQLVDGKNVLKVDIYQDD